MKEDKKEKVSQLKKEQTPPCRTCGKQTKRMMFRTGSMQHPGRDMNVCSGCGSRE